MVNNFRHENGVHCESSAMRDVFEYIGFPMTEAMAFGLDATMGFGYFDKSNKFLDVSEGDIPFFLGGKQGTITPNSLACRLLGIAIRKQSFTSADKAWEESKTLIDKNIPLIIQCDLCYLDYMNLEEEIHFGGHAIVLAGYDEDKGVALVADTEYEGLQEVNIDYLKKARNSEFGPSFMRPKNVQYSLSPKEKRPPLAAAVKLAIQEVCKNMLRPSLGNNGIQGLKMFANAVPTWEEELKGTVKNPYNDKVINKARLMFELTSGYIETYGTGGSCFRKLYLTFLKELLTHPELKEGPKAWTAGDFSIIEDCIPIIEKSARQFTFIANILHDAVDKYKDDCINHVSFGELYNMALYIHSEEEELFKKLSKIKV